MTPPGTPRRPSGLTRTARSLMPCAQDHVPGLRAAAGGAAAGEHPLAGARGTARDVSALPPLASQGGSVPAGTGPLRRIGAWGADRPAGEGLAGAGVRSPSSRHSIFFAVQVQRFQVDRSARDDPRSRRAQRPLGAPGALLPHLRRCAPLRRNAGAGVSLAAAAPAPVFNLFGRFGSEVHLLWLPDTHQSRHRAVPLPSHAHLAVPGQGSAALSAARGYRCLCSACSSCQAGSMLMPP